MENQNSGTCYYAIFNKLGELGDKKPIHFSTNNKQNLVDTLNTIYKQMTGETSLPYTIEDIEPVIYMGRELDHFISDDWADVTDSKKVYNRDLTYYPNAIELKCN